MKTRFELQLSDNPSLSGTLPTELAKLSMQYLYVACIRCTDSCQARCRSCLIDQPRFPPSCSLPLSPPRYVYRTGVSGTIPSEFGATATSQSLVNLWLMENALK